LIRLGDQDGGAIKRREALHDDAPQLVVDGAPVTITGEGNGPIDAFVHTLVDGIGAELNVLGAAFVGACAWLTSLAAPTLTPIAEAAAAPNPSPAYFKTSRRVVTLVSRLFLNHSQPACSRNSILQN
jgi:hypothetical protein